MIEIKCSKAQFKRIVDAMVYSALDIDGKCVLGKKEFTCHYLSKFQVADCHTCIRQNVRRVE